ncbi:hypothetical protein KY317_03800 [Candidatus Woesearchaeota archaeon]|nr:hypothetical protein [Candidatus Woesearchaeota archaeon]
MTPRDLLARMVLILAVFLALPIYGQDEEKGHAWPESFAEAKTESKKSGKNMFADFTSKQN